MPGLAQAIEMAGAMVGAALTFGFAYLSAALLVLVVAGFYAWFVPKGAAARSARRSLRSKRTRRNPSASLETAP